MGLRWQMWRAQQRGRNRLLGLLEALEVEGGCGEKRSVGSWSEAVGVFQLKFFQRDMVSLASKELGEGTERNKHTLQCTKNRDKPTHRHWLSSPLSLSHTDENRDSSGYFDFNLSGGNQNKLFNLQDLSVCVLSLELSCKTSKEYALPLSNTSLKNTLVSNKTYCMLTPWVLSTDRYWLLKQCLHWYRKGLYCLLHHVYHRTICCCSLKTLLTDCLYQTGVSVSACSHCLYLNKSWTAW